MGKHEIFLFSYESRFVFVSNQIHFPFFFFNILKFKHFVKTRKKKINIMTQQKINKSPITEVINENESCRFCFENYVESNEIVFHPCKCKQGIHRTCLLQWIFRGNLNFDSEQNFDSNNLHCHVCNTEFQIEKKIIWKYNFIKGFAFLLYFFSFGILFYHQINFWFSDIYFKSINLNVMGNVGINPFVFVQLGCILLTNIIFITTFASLEKHNSLEQNITFFPQFSFLIKPEVYLVLGTLHGLYNILLVCTQSIRFVILYLIILTDVDILLSCVYIFFLYVIQKKTIFPFHSFDSRISIIKKKS